MPRKHVDVSVSHAEFEDLNNALEDHRDGFKKMAEEATNGFGLEPAYWEGRAQEVEGLRETIHEHSTDELEQSESSTKEADTGPEVDSARDRDFESDSRQ
ncbi:MULTISPECIES: hypothetical protein [Micrococcaceae]|uniref:hypothetical protein n=1 Tax=Micrococcaceae TaxID=1268 RepID=UPI000CFC5153|nr:MULTISPECIES: hypothetical protein [unclassified Arthrobacter]